MQARVVAIIKADCISESAKAGEEVTIVLDKTVFYGDSGGQAGDRGKLTADAVLMFRMPKAAERQDIAYCIN
jgi:alanyl-tRNA synthetase